MDAQSIITQASRDEDNGSSTSCLDKVPEAKAAPATRSGGIFTRLFCCFRPQITRPVIDSSISVVDDNTDKSKSQTNTVRVNYLLKPVSDKYRDKKCVVIDLDETLVHSSFQPVKNADFIIPVEIDGTIHQVYVLKRPYVEEFLKKMGELFECVLFTASLGKYADPVTDLLDKWNVFQARLFRESCVFHKGNYVKDLSRLGRDVDRVLIVDNSPMSYFFHPKNAVPVVSWFDDSNDRELLDLIPFFEEISKVNDIYTFLENSRLPLGSNNPLQMVVGNYSGTFHSTGGAPSLNATFSPLPTMPLPSPQENNVNGAVNSQDSTAARQDRSTMHQQQNNIQQQLQQQQQFTQHSMLLRTPNTLPRPQQNSLQIQLQRSSLQSNPARQNLVIHHVGSAKASSGGSSSSLQQQAANHH